MNKCRTARVWPCFLLVATGIFLIRTPPLRGADAQVSIVDFAFNPASVGIQVNDRVVWTWVGPTIHTTTSTTGLWDSGFMSATASQFTFTFKNSGSFPYICTLHPFMTGSVSVSPAAPSGADLTINLAGNPSPVAVSNQLTYTLLVKNSGPSDAADVVVTDSLPAGVSFVSARTSQGSSATNAAGWRWDAGPLAAGANATASLVLLPLAIGALTNSSVVALNDPSIVDPVPANNSALLVTTVNPPGPGGSTNAPIQIETPGAIVFDPQTGLFEQTLQLTNSGSNTITAARVSVLGLPPNVTLYNASGSTNGVPFVEFDQALAAGSSVDLLLEYYRSNRLDFAPTGFEVAVVPSTTVSPPIGGTLLQLDRTPFFFDGQLVIEFVSIPGRTYVVEYSADAQSWIAAVPPLIAAGTRVQWTDGGPPKTQSAPGTVGQRFYRVLQLP